jgi:hypothetical protein
MLSLVVGMAAPPPVPVAEPAMDEVALHWAARAAVARGVSFLKGRSANDDGGWVTPPFRHAKVVGTTNIVFRYSEKKVPLYEYETYTVYERRPGATSQSARTLQAVERKRIKGVLDPQGRTILVYDRNGPIERTESRPLYEKGGVEQWMYGRLGQNGMALYTLLRCGVPEDDEGAQRLRQNLVDFAGMYGLPDSTWDLAWMTAAFARLPDDDARKLTQAAASKLLDGQILDGDARGLWGPVCIHVPLLATAYLYEQELAQQLEKAKLALKEKPDARSRERDVTKLEDSLHAFQNDMQRISMLAIAFDNIDAPAVRLDDEISPPVLVPGAVHYVFNQTTADMDSTSLVLFTLREVARAGRMPPETWRPVFEGKRGAPPAEKSDAVLARAVHALARLQNPQGGWTECNLHQPVTSFDKLGKMIPGVPADPRTFKPLPSPETPLSCLQGYNALLDAAEAVGLQKVLARFRAPLLGGRTRALARLAEVPVPVKKAPPPDSQQELRCRTAGLALLPGTRLQDQRPLWMRTAFDLLAQQQTNGSWRVAGRELAMSSSLRTRLDTLEKRDEKDRTKLMNRAGAHVRANWHSDYRGWLRSTDEVGSATCYALLALVEHIRPPVVVARWGEGLTPTPLADVALQGLSSRLGADWSYVVQSFPLTFERIEASPLLFLEGRGAFAPDTASGAALAGFVRGGGLVVAHAAATSEGNAFLDSLAVVIGKAIDGGQPEDLANDDRLLGDFAGKLGRALRGIRRKDGSLAVVLLPIAETGSAVGQVFAPVQAARVTERLVERSLDAGLLAADFPSNIAALGEPDVVFADAMKYLRGMARRDIGAVTASGQEAPDAAASQPPESVPATELPEQPAAPRAPAADEVL